MRPLAERGIKLRGKVTLLRRALTLQLGERGVHLVDLLIQLVQGFLRFAQLRGGEMASSCALSWASRETRCCCCCLIARCLRRYRPEWI
jgi:hypothetical protein